jgi:serine/threonine protein kinase
MGVVGARRTCRSWTSFSPRRTCRTRTILSPSRRQPTSPVQAAGGQGTLVGRCLGPDCKYRLTALLGGGALGEVYAAERTLLKDRVAVRVLNPTVSRPGMVERVWEEFAALARLGQHPNILPVYDVGREDSLAYLVMPLAEGRAIADRLPRATGQNWLPRQALPLARAVLGALDYAHAQGVVHGDVKPANILFQGDHVFLADFRLSALVRDDPNLTQIGIGPEAAEYLAPEQAQGGSLAPDGRADLYSFGVVLYELLTGRVPYQGRTLPDLALQHQRAPLPPPRERTPALSEQVEAVLVRALAKERTERYQTGADFAAALAATE